MNFISIFYGLFLLSVLGIYWSVDNQKLRLWTLLIASLVFYGSLDIQYILLLLVLTLINFRLGLEIGNNTAHGKYAVNWELSNEEWQFSQSDWNRRRLKLLWLGVSLNVLLLLGFKYLPTFSKYVFNLQINSPDSAFKLIAPLGISFFTFECIAYLVDVYRGAPATKNFLKFVTYKLFFAKLISGPITRYHTLASQFYRPNFPSAEGVSQALWLISRGAVKKGLLADNLGIFVDLCFGNLQRAGSIDLWLATFAYGLQLYLDFSGYVDIARGSALLFGLVLPENFNFPYFSTSIAEFWRRWHMTLGDWLRNYVYFPLGGSRQGLTRTCTNLFIVMVIAGIWHGSAWGFIVWGVFHGLALGVHRLTDVMSDRFENLAHFWENPLGIVFAWFLTQLMVFTSWIWFRLPNLQDSSWVIQHLWGHSADAQFVQKVYVEALNMNQYQLTSWLGILALLMGIIYVFNGKLKLEFNWPLKLVFVPLCLYAVWLLAPEGSLPYIYFDF
ncbi:MULTISPECIES: MBOAT family O-acyltransferase [Cyanophyceae]|uniref:MBOAT family O-acyltransferase n=1 Tax=Cyanophyceae TaxID=3028117 RepID=UPI00232E7E9A|nr:MULTISPECIES: MBOAT family protein [Cyanophyceae]MDB9357426.1 MBOAT family protein [Nodularia spumigena CS-587/03]MDB9306300.1 MBOAT family protein [Nodularia spumigena CS-591/12]MDB9341723.1 MBOAT family protein [Nodularia spumigena CS-589/07]MDB9398379.1 MBOAT family protein [Microcystis aeruginosa CS-567/02-A1]MDB9498847.1 MBOAT family protein [Nodularia spumigena CS-336/02]